MVEVKADALEQSFEAFEDEDDGVAALKAELETAEGEDRGGRDRGAAAGARRGEVGGSCELRRPISPARDRERARDQGDRQLVRRDRRLCGAARRSTGDRRDADGDLADPRDRQCREGRQRRLSQADRQRRHAVGLGRLRGGAAGDRHADLHRNRAGRRASSTPTRRRRSRCSTMRCSTSRSGWRTRSRPSSRGPKARRSSAAPASASRSAS